MVYLFQGNRNPFIDHPEWVDAVLGGQAGGKGVRLLCFGLPWSSSGAERGFEVEAGDGVHPDFRAGQAIGWHG